MVWCFAEKDTASLITGPSSALTVWQKVIMRLTLSCLWILVMMLPLSGCGYRMVGGGSLPGGVETIAVTLLENRTSETGLETMMTDALITELNRRRKGGVSDADHAQAALGGTIQALGRDTIARRGINTSLERRVYVVVNLTLTQNDGEVLWKSEGLRAEQAYAVSEDDSAVTDANRREAISELSRRLAETVVRRLTDDF